MNRLNPLMLSWSHTWWFHPIPGIRRSFSREKIAKIRWKVIWMISLKKWNLETFFKGCHHPGGSFIYWAHVTSLTCKANVQSRHSSLTQIDTVHTNHNRKGRFLTETPQQKKLACAEFWTGDLPAQIFALLPLLTYWIWPFSWSFWSTLMLAALAALEAVSF